MASGDLTASAPVACIGGTAIKAAVDELNLAAVTDTIEIIPTGAPNEFLVFKIERAA